MTEELIVLVDDEGRSIGSMPKPLVHHGQTPLHRAFSAYLFDESGRLLVTRRALGLPMTVLAAVFVLYIFAGPWLPDALAHRGASLERLVSHMWLTTEGVYGVALGVSVSYIFIFVLLGYHRNYWTCWMVTAQWPTS